MSIGAHLGERNYALRFLDAAGEPAFRHSPSAPEPEAEEYIGASGLQSVAESLAAIQLTGPHHNRRDARDADAPRALRAATPRARRPARSRSTTGSWTSWPPTGCGGPCWRSWATSPGPRPGRCPRPPALPQTRLPWWSRSGPGNPTRCSKPSGSAAGGPSPCPPRRRCPRRGRPSTTAWPSTLAAPDRCAARIGGPAMTLAPQRSAGAHAGPSGRPRPAAPLGRDLPGTPKSPDEGRRAALADGPRGGGRRRGCGAEPQRCAAGMGVVLPRPHDGPHGGLHHGRASCAPVAQRLRDGRRAGVAGADPDLHVFPPEQHPGLHSLRRHHDAGGPVPAPGQRDRPRGKRPGGPQRRASSCWSAPPWGCW